MVYKGTRWNVELDTCGESENLSAFALLNPSITLTTLSELLIKVHFFIIDHYGLSFLVYPSLSFVFHLSPICWKPSSKLYLIRPWSFFFATQGYTTKERLLVRGFNVKVEIFTRVKTTCVWSLERNREKFNLLVIIIDTSLERGLHYEIVRK